MLQVTSDSKSGYLEFLVDGSIDRAEYQAAVDAVDSLLETHRHINLVEIVRDIGWIAPDVWWKDMIFHLTHHNFLHRVAIVSNKGWVGPVTRFFAPLYPAEIRTFAEAEVEAARVWALHGDAGAPAGTVDPHLDFA